MSLWISSWLMTAWMCWACARAAARDKDMSPKLREVVSSLQEQLTALQHEQQKNRMVIRSLESRLDEELQARNRRRSRMTSSVKSIVDNSWAVDAEDGGKPTNETKEDSILNRRTRSRAASKRASFGRMDSVYTWTKRPEVTVVTTVPTPPETSSYIMETTTRGSVTECALECQQIRLQLETLSEQIQKLRQETETQKAVREQQAAQLSELKSGHITTKWLQKTVGDVRKEISELAAALNISMALRESQQLENMLDRVRSDVAMLRTEVDHKSAFMSKHAAALEEIREEVQELRAMASAVTTDHQQLIDEVSALKEEIFRNDEDLTSSTSNSNSGSWPEDKESTGSSSEGSGSEGSSSEGSGEEGSVSESDFISEKLFPEKPDQHVTTELDAIKSSLKRLQSSQSFLSKEVQYLRHNHSASQAALSNLQHSLARLDNNTSTMYSEQNAMSKTLDDVRERLTMAEEKTLRNGRNIVNITEAMTGMDKVHSSTIQLFEALESLEDEYSKSIGDLQKEVSKFEFNVAQVQGSFDILRHDQSSQYEDLKSLKGEFAALQREFRKDHYRLTMMQNDFLNRSLQRCAEEGQEALQDLKLANLELQLAKLARKEEDHKVNANMMYSKLMQKVDRNALQAMEQSQKGVVDDMRNLSSQLPGIVEMQTELKQEILKFVRRLPSDCSMSDIPESAGEYRSGIYLIHVPHSQHAKEMYCDMSSAGNRWTVIQRRVDGSEDFFRNWADYKRGFGNPSGEFWAGNEAIHRLTNHRNYTLRIDMWDVFDRYIYAEYGNFRVSSEDDEYRLEVGEYSGNASDSLKHHHNMAFSTHDRDNDASSTHCAMYYSGGWWYQHCQYVNVNGRYAIGLTWYDAANKDWVQLAKVEMKIQATES